MEYTKLKSINEYRSENINPMKFPDTIFEMYSVPIYETGHPEYLHGSDIGSNKVLVQKNDVLLCKINPRINRVWVVADESEHQNIASSEWIVVRSKTYNPEFLAWYFRTPKFKKLMTSEVTGIGGSLTRAQPKAVAEYPIPVIPRQRQDEITLILNKSYDIIMLRKRELQSLDKLIKARFVEMFGDPNTEELRWQEVNIGDNCFVTKLAGFEYTNYIHYEEAGDVVMVKAQNVKNGSLNEKELSYISNEVSDSLPRSQLAPGDVVMTYVGANIGDVAIINNKHKYHLAPNVAKIRPDGKVYDSIFFMYLLMMKTDYIMRNSADTAKAALGMERIRKLKVFVPPLDDQKQFASFVSQVDKSKAAVQAALDKAQLLFDSLMQEYFG